MKVRILTLRNAPHVEVERLAAYLKKNKGLDSSYEQIYLDQLPTPVQGLNNLYPKAWGFDATPYLKGNADCDWLIVLWDATKYADWIATSGWTGSQILSSMPISEADDFYRIASHEIEHGTWAILAFKFRVPSQDRMDVNLLDQDFSREMEPDSDSGNRAKSNFAMKPYLPLLQSYFSRPQAPVLPDKPSVIQSLTWYVNYLLGRQKLGPTANGYQDLVAKYGDPLTPDFEARNIVSFKLPYPLKYQGIPVTTARAHRLAVPNFVSFLTELKQKGLDKHIQNYSGIYAARSKRTNTQLSVHAFGCAGDFEAETHPLGGKVGWPQEVLDIAAKYGFINGGTFPTPDFQHFQLCRNY